MSKAELDVTKMRDSLRLLLNFRDQLGIHEGEKPNLQQLAAMVMPTDSTQTNAAALLYGSMIEAIPANGATKGVYNELFVIGMLFGVYLSELGRAKLILREKE